MQQKQHTMRESISHLSPIHACTPQKVNTTSAPELDATGAFAYMQPFRNKKKTLRSIRKIKLCVLSHTQSSLAVGFENLRARRV
jgi:hypothetical protein